MSRSLSRRRANNEGTIMPYKNGRYRAWVTIGYDVDTGKPIRRSKVLATEQDCVVWIQQMKSQYGPIAAKRTMKNPSMPLAEYFEDWFKYYVMPTVKESTYVNYRQVYDIHIKPELGDIPLKDVTTDNIQRLCVGKLKDNYSVRTVHLIRYIISAGFKQAVKGGVVVFNPADGVKLPANELPARPHLDVKQAKALLHAVEGHQYYLCYVLALTHGMRRGEILGLTWPSIDLDARTITIDKSLNRVSKIDAQEGETQTKLVVSKPKTKYSQRIIPMSEYVYHHLVQIKKLQEEAKFTSGYVFATSNDTPTSPDNLLRHYRRVKEKLGILDTTFHDLRHTFATLAAEPPVSGNPFVIKAILGHSNRDITAHYSHSTHKSMLEVIEKLTKSLNLYERHI